jgi:4-hydroxybenzoate polyprenyltransferase
MKASEMSIIRQWIVVWRLQALPITLAPGVVGYLLVEGSVIDNRFGLLVATLVLSHAGLMGLNEAIDAEYDKIAGREGKPISNGDLNKTPVALIAGLFVVSSFTMFALLGSVKSMLFYFVGIMIMLLYNLYSKEKPWVDLTTGISSAAIVGAASMFNGGPIMPDVYFFAAQFGIVTAVVHTIADLKDIGSGEETIYTMFACRVEREDGWIKLVSDGTFKVAAISVFTIQMLFGTGAVLISPQKASLIDVLVVISGILMAGFSFYELNREGYKKMHTVERSIMLYVLASGVLLIYPLVLYTSWRDIVVPLVALVALPFIVQKIQYGKAFYFP